MRVSAFLWTKKPLKIKGFKLGYKDSNLKMLESESSALPFGDTPIYLVYQAFMSATNDIITDSLKMIKHYFLFFSTFFIPFLITVEKLKFP